MNESRFTRSLLLLALFSVSVAQAEEEGGAGAAGASPAADSPSQPAVAAPETGVAASESTPTPTPAGPTAPPGSVLPPARVAPRLVTERWLIETLLENNASLSVSQLTLERAGEVVREQDGQYPFIFQADAGYTRSRVPAVAGAGVVVSGRDSLVLGSQLEKEFVTGTRASLRVEGERFDRDQSATSSVNTASLGGTGYQATARATVVQPLLAGAGRTVNEAAWRAAVLDQKRQKMSVLAQKSQLIADVLLAYWDLWYLERATEIEQSSLELSYQQRAEAQKKVEFGALSAADALKFESQASALEEAFLAAQASETAQSLALGQLIGLPADSRGFRAGEEEPSVAVPGERTALLARVVEHNPELRSLRDEVRLAEERRRTAGEQYRPSLDLTAWVEATGLSAGRARPALERLGQLEAVSVYGGLVYRTALDEQRYDAARAQANYDVRLAEGRLRVQTEMLTSTTEQLLVDFERAVVSGEAAARTLAIAERQARNERQRFALGAATPLDVQVAEAALREARLRVVAAKVQKKRIEIKLAEATGELIRAHLPQSSGRTGPGQTTVSPSRASGVPASVRPSATGGGSDAD